MSEPEGLIEVLSVGRGDLKVVISKASKVELEEGRRVITDMLKRGYAIFVEVAPGQLERVTRFDPKRLEYIVESPTDPALDEGPKIPGRRGRGRGRYPADKSKATAVGRTAGG